MFALPQTDLQREARSADPFALLAPSWEPTHPLTVVAWKSAFDHEHELTIGVEEELMVVDAEQFELAPVPTRYSPVSPIARALRGPRHGDGFCPKSNEIYPRSGIPPLLATWDDLLRFLDWGGSGGLFPDASRFWHEMRLHLLHGTLEIKVADT